jgi:hypothetical protein
MLFLSQYFFSFLSCWCFSICLRADAIFKPGNINITSQNTVWEFLIQGPHLRTTNPGLNPGFGGLRFGLRPVLGPQYKFFTNYTVPKAFSMHETFPKLLGKISKTTWKYWGGQNFQVVLETVHKKFMVVLEILTGKIFPGSFGKSS